MDYTLSGLRNRVLDDKLDDIEFDSDIIDNYINDTQRDIFNRSELSFQEEIFSGKIPTGYTIFKFPANVALPLSQVITSPDGSQKDMKSSYTDFRTFNSLYPTPANNDAGDINCWTLFGGNILMARPTDKDYDMTIFYIKKPTKLENDADVPEIPEEFSELLILGAYMRALKRNEDWEEADNIEAEYEKQLLLLASRYSGRQQNGPIKMKNRQIRG